MKMIMGMGQLYKAIVEEKQFGVGKPGERLKVLTEAFLNTALGKLWKGLICRGNLG